MGVSMTTVRAVRFLGHDIFHLRQLDLIRMPDEEIVSKARSEGRIVLTFDLDFGEIMAASRRDSPSVILFRMRNHTPITVTRRLLRVIQECEFRW